MVRLCLTVPQNVLLFFSSTKCMGRWIELSQREWACWVTPEERSTVFEEEDGDFARDQLWWCWKDMVPFKYVHACLFLPELWQDSSHADKNPAMTCSCSYTSTICWISAHVQKTEEIKLKYDPCVHLRHGAVTDLKLRVRRMRYKTRVWMSLR